MALKVAKGKGPSVDPMEELRDQIFALTHAVKALPIQQETLAAAATNGPPPTGRPHHPQFPNTGRLHEHFNLTFDNDASSDVSDDDDTVSMVNLFAHRPPNFPPATGGAPRWDQGFRIEIPEFTGSLDPAEFLD